MSLYITSINSGSNGNCYYVGNQREAVLIDAGVSCRITEERMKRLGLSLNKVKAIFITHEHTDHTRGVEVLSRRHQIPVYLTPSTYEKSRLGIAEDFVKPVKAYIPVSIGDLSVTAFPKKHDAVDPHSFTVTYEGITIGVFTDIGVACDDVKRNFRMCSAAFLEANYDEEMLEKGLYPQYLKTRIRGDHGHLSNRQALDLFLAHKSPFMTHLLLSHLSQDNNNPDLLLKLFRKHSNGTHISIASRHEESEVYCISANPLENGEGRGAIIAPFPVQMTLF